VNAPDWKVISSILASWGCTPPVETGGVDGAGAGWGAQAANTSMTLQIIRRKALCFIANLLT
jgi:hypothetical protein